MAKMIFVPVEKLEYPPENVSLRKPPSESDKDWDVTLRLKDTVAIQGMSNPFSVREEDGHLYICDGFRRAKVAMMLKAEGKMFTDGINVQLTEKSDWDALEAMISANYNVKRTLSAQEVNAINRLSQVRNYTLEELAQKCGLSIQYVTQILKIKYLPQAAQEAINEGLMNITNAIQLGKLPAEEIDDEWIEKACSDTAEKLTAAVSEKLNEIRKTNRLNKEGKEPAFEPKSKVMKKEELSILLTRAETDFDSDPTDYNRGRLDVLKEIFALDEQSIRVQKAEWEKKQAEAAEKKEERKKKMEDKKAEEIKEFLEKQGKKIVDA